MGFSRLTLSAGLPRSWIWREENGSLFQSFLPLSLPLSLASAYLEFPPYFSGNRYVKKVREKAGWILWHLKALTDHLGGGSRVYSFDPTGKLEARLFFLFHFKGPSSQDQQKTIRRRLITFKVTLTGQSHFMQMFILSKVTLRDYTNAIQWMYAIGPKNPLV